MHQLVSRCLQKRKSPKKTATDLVEFVFYYDYVTPITFPATIL